MEYDLSALVPILSQHIGSCGAREFDTRMHTGAPREKIQFLGGSKIRLADLKNIYSYFECCSWLKK
jgi:hypothetical protein